MDFFRRIFQQLSHSKISSHFLWFSIGVVPGYLAWNQLIIGYRIVPVEGKYLLMPKTSILWKWIWICFRSKKLFKIWKFFLNFKFQSKSEFGFFKSQKFFEMKKYSQYIWIGECMYCFVWYDMNKHMHATGVSIKNEFCNFK